MCSGFKDDIVGADFIKLDFYMFNISWLAWNSFDIWIGTDLKFKFSSSLLMLDVNTLVSSINMVASEGLLINPRKSSMYILNNSSSRTEPWGTPCLILLQLD